jgi:hypothetical protein
VRSFGGPRHAAAGLVRRCDGSYPYAIHDL